MDAQRVEVQDRHDRPDHDHESEHDRHVAHPVGPLWQGAPQAHHRNADPGAHVEQRTQPHPTGALPVETRGVEPTRSEHEEKHADGEREPLRRVEGHFGKT